MATRILTLFDEEDFFQEEAPAAKPVNKEAPAGAPEATTPDNDTPAVAAVPEVPATAEILQQGAAAAEPESSAPETPAAQQMEATIEALAVAEQPEAIAAELEQPAPETGTGNDVKAGIETSAVTDTPEQEAIVTEQEQSAQDGTECDMEARIETPAVTETPEPEAIVGEQESPAQEAEPEQEVEATVEIPAVTATPEPEAVVAEQEQPVQKAEQEEDQEAIMRAADEELNKQIISELIQLDYTSLIHKDYPFDLNKAQVITREKATPAPAAQPDMQEETVPEEDRMTAEEEVFEEIVPLPEWNLDKKYYTIGEVAQLFSVNTSHIRFWTNEFKLKPRTTRKGDRLYNPNDIAELRLIHHLVKEKKHTIKGAREKLKAGKSGVSDKLDLKESLTGLRDLLVQIKEQL